MATPKKIKVKVGDNFPVAIDKRFLDALSVDRFGRLYSDETKTEVNVLIRDLVGSIKTIHPLDVHYLIAKSLMSKSKAALLP